MWKYKKARAMAMVQGSIGVYDMDVMEQRNTMVSMGLTQS